MNDRDRYSLYSFSTWRLSTVVLCYTFTISLLRLTALPMWHSYLCRTSIHEAMEQQSISVSKVSVLFLSNTHLTICSHTLYQTYARSHAPIRTHIALTCTHTRTYKRAHVHTIYEISKIYTHIHSHTDLAFFLFFPAWDCVYSYTIGRNSLYIASAMFCNGGSQSYQGPIWPVSYPCTECRVDWPHSLSFWYVYNLPHTITMNSL